MTVSAKISSALLLLELPVPQIVNVMPMKSVSLEIVSTLATPILVVPMLDALFLITENSVFVQKGLREMQRWSVFVFPTPVSPVMLVQME